ncbi:MAG: hypothetical protein R2695_02145 [Acidimicrobiales bacterium]
MDRARDSYPAGRADYLSWRRDQKRRTRRSCGSASSRAAYLSTWSSGQP